MRLRSRFSSFQASLWIGVLISSVFASEAKAGNVVSIWFKTPGDKYETHADSSTKGIDSNGNIYYYYSPSRPVDAAPVCLDPNGLAVSYFYQNQWFSTYYQTGGSFYLWHGRMTAFVGIPWSGGTTYTANDEGEVYISDLPDGNYVVVGEAPLLTAYIVTKDGHGSWFGDNGQTTTDLVKYNNVLSYLGSATGRYQSHTWYDMYATTSYGDWHPYANGFEIYGGSVDIDVRISAVSSGHVTRVY